MVNVRASRPNIEGHWPPAFVFLVTKARHVLVINSLVCARAEKAEICSLDFKSICIAQISRLTATTHHIGLAALPAFGRPNGQRSSSGRHRQKVLTFQLDWSASLRE